MSTTGLHCKYCGKQLESELYRNMPGIQYTIFCPNETCTVMPGTDYTNPSRALKEALEFTLPEEAEMIRKTQER